MHAHGATNYRKGLNEKATERPMARKVANQICSMACVITYSVKCFSQVGRSLAEIIVSAI